MPDGSAWLRLLLLPAAAGGGVYGYANRIDAADAEGVLSGLAFFALLALVAKAVEATFELEEPRQKAKVERYLAWWVLYAAVGALGIALGGRTALGSSPGDGQEPELLAGCTSKQLGDLPATLPSPDINLWCYAPTASETLTFWEYVLPLVLLAGFVIPLWAIARQGKRESEQDRMPC